jgi:acyl-CoA dehydrogenase
MGLGHVELAFVQAEAAKSAIGPFILNCEVPDEGNMHTLLHWGTEAQKVAYLRPLCEGVVMSCFAMTEPEIAGSDPTRIQTLAVRDGDEWVINGQKWFISNAHRARFAIVIARTEDNPDPPQAGNSAFLVDIPSDGWTEVRQIETMHGSTGHSEILIRGSSCVRRQHARRPRTRPSARPASPRSSPAGPLHAMDCPSGNRTGHDG